LLHKTCLLCTAFVSLTSNSFHESTIIIHIKLNAILNYACLQFAAMHIEYFYVTDKAEK